MTLENMDSQNDRRPDDRKPESHDALRLLDKLIRAIGGIADPGEVAARGLAVIGPALGARGAALMPAGAGDAALARWGADAGEELRRAALASIPEGRPRFTREKGRARAAVPMLREENGAVGALVLERDADWTSEERLFLETAARSLAVALIAAERLRSSQEQGESLARRNEELEALHELTELLSEVGSDEEALQATLDLVLRRLKLDAGWIFWGRAKERRLELAASRGISEAFVRRSKESGIGTCLCRDVFATGALRVARNTMDCPRMPELVRGEPSMTHACIPLKFERGTMGVMNIANRGGSVFAASDLQFLEIAGHHLCLAVDKLRSARAENRYNAEARALSALARAIGGSLDQEEVLVAVGDYARELLGADRCALFLGDGKRPLRLAHLAGPPVEGFTVGLIADADVLGSNAIPAALADRETLVIQDARTDPRVNPDFVQRWSIRTQMVVPLLAHDRVEGALLAIRTRASPWSDDEVELAGALAHQAAMAIENSRLYREAQEALLAQQQAQFGMMRAERLAAVGTLAASLAHEVRNPLNSIHLQLVLLARRVSGLTEPLSGAMSSLVTTAQKEIARLDSLVEDFLSLSTVDRLGLSETDLNKPVRDVLALMAPVMAQTKTTLVEELSEDLPRVPLDPEKMRQVLINLIRNALDAMGNGGTLTVATQSSGDGVIVEIGDTGPGIDPKLDVFDLFMTTKRGGTGLGLPIARRIVEAHGGSLTFESTGKGTTFYIALPVP
jgi:signal transduction histidine kinase